MSNFRLDRCIFTDLCHFKRLYLGKLKNTKSYFTHICCWAPESTENFPRTFLVWCFLAKLALRHSQFEFGEQKGFPHRTALIRKYSTPIMVKPMRTYRALWIMGLSTPEPLKISLGDLAPLLRVEFPVLDVDAVGSSGAEMLRGVGVADTKTQQTDTSAAERKPRKVILHPGLGSEKNRRGLSVPVPKQNRGASRFVDTRWSLKEVHVSKLTSVIRWSALCSWPLGHSEYAVRYVFIYEAFFITKDTTTAKMADWKKSNKNKQKFGHTIRDNLK